MADRGLGNVFEIDSMSKRVAEAELASITDEATNMKYGRKKASALVKTLGKAQQRSFYERMQTAAFTLSTDGSNDNRSKQFPISDEPKIRVLRQNLVSLIVKVLCRFIKPAAVSGCVSEGVDFKSSYNLKDNKDLVICDAACSFIADFEGHADQAVLWGCKVVL
ncbi:hypothetical protein CHS0354_017629 [Potamilus streckersoni]|uniref:Uncharacterized protein n=1 Tax=Potamilus streckersoni TaxID=2493646 RepID=A0AAE0T2M5_9BIVA|nr:hypothetical protein CHS0354_017629 [Potamilus streckersoni]